MAYFYVQVSSLPNIVAFTGVGSTTDGEAAYAFMYTINGKLYGFNTQWRALKQINISGVCELRQQYNQLTFITYKDSIMYLFGSIEGTHIPAGTIFNNAYAPDLMNRYFIFN